MKLRKSRTVQKGRIEIIPMIDVMFFLLATFMLASLSMQNLDSLQVNLPEGEAETERGETRYAHINQGQQNLYQSNSRNARFISGHAETITGRLQTKIDRIRRQ